MESVPDDTDVLEPAQVELAPSPHAFETLLGFREDAFRFAVRITGNAIDADDVVQEAYLKLLRFRGELRSGPEARTLLLRVVANLARDLHLSKRRRQAREAKASQNCEMSCKLDPPMNDLRAAIDRALSSLNEKQRLPVCLHYEQGLSYAEASKILDVPEGELRVYAQRGLQKMRGKLKQQGYDAAPAIIAGLLSRVAASANAEGAAMKALASSGSRTLGSEMRARIPQIWPKVLTVGLAVVCVVAWAFAPKAAMVNPAVQAVMPAPVVAIADGSPFFELDGIVIGEQGGKGAADRKVYRCKQDEPRRVKISLLRSADVDEKAGVTGSISVYDQDGSDFIAVRKTSPEILFERPARIGASLDPSGIRIFTFVEWHGKRRALTITIRRPVGEQAHVEIELLSVTGSNPQQPQDHDHVDFYHVGHLVL